MKKYQNQKADLWYQKLKQNLAAFPFSFVYEQKKYEGFSSEYFTLKKEEVITDEKKETTNYVFTLDDKLEISLYLTYYPAFGATEWTVWFENTGSENSGILKEMETCLTFEGEKPMLKGILGDHENFYHPYAIDLTEMPANFYTDSGRATHIHFPYFNLEYGNEGAMLAIGWAGTWKADFSYCDGVTEYRARSAYDLCTYLKPGEKIRTALFVRAAYQERNENYATNFWRSWFVECNLPPYDKNGRKLEPFSTCCLSNDTGLPNTDGSISERYFTWRPSLEKMIAEDVKVDFRWFDAGWYIAPSGKSPDGSTPDNDWWTTVGTWELDPVKWPGKTFLESTDFARANGMKTLMWFEPERITDPDNLVKNYGYKKEWAIIREGYANIANNIGDPECLKWTTERVCKTLRENKVEMYREDNNSDPAALWHYLDEREGEGRKGITECKFIQAHYQMWDDIIECTLSYGGCGFVDSCASGGGRNDLESMRRGVPLLRSDYDRTTTAKRLSMTTAFNKWIPFCGAITKEQASQLAPKGESDPYIWRASYLPALNVSSQFVQDPDQDFGILRFGLKEWKRVNPYLLKDFYVHTPWHTEYDKASFTAFSFVDPEAEKGVLLMFRMEQCGMDTLKIMLPYAKEGAVYTLTDEDTKEVIECEGTVLKRGISFQIAEKRTSRLIWVEKK